MYIFRSDGGAINTQFSQENPLKFIHYEAENNLVNSQDTLRLESFINSIKMTFVGVNPPEEPKNYDPDNKYKDPVVYFKHREAAVAEEYVKVAEAKVKPCFQSI